MINSSSLVIEGPDYIMSLDPCLRRLMDRTLNDWRAMPDKESPRALVQKEACSGICGIGMAIDSRLARKRGSYSCIRLRYRTPPLVLRTNWPWRSYVLRPRRGLLTTTVK